MVRGQVLAPALLAALLGACLAFLSLYPLPGWGPDFGSAFTGHHVLGRSPGEVWRDIGQGDAHPPLYYLLAWAWLRGKTSHGLDGLLLLAREERTLSLIFQLLLGATLAAGGYLLGKGPGAMAALGLALASRVWPEGPDFRMYPLAAAWVTLAAVAYLRNRPFAGSLFGALALYTHYLSGLLLLPYALFALSRSWRGQGARSLLALAPYGLFLPWVPWLLGQIGAGRSLPWMRPEPEAVFGFALNAWPGPVLLLAATGLLPLALRRRVPLALLLALAALYTWYLVSLGINVVMGSRYLLPFVPLVALGLAEAAGTLSQEGFRRLALLLGVVFLLAGFAYSRYGRPAEPVEDYWKYGYLSLVLVREGKVEAVYLQDGRYRFLLPQALREEGLPPERLYIGSLPQSPNPSLLVRYKGTPPLLDPYTPALQRWAEEVAPPRRIYEDRRGEVWFLPGTRGGRGHPDPYHSSWSSKEGATRRGLRSLSPATEKRQVNSRTSLPRRTFR